MEDAFAAASNARDAESVVKYYSDDAHTMPPNAPTLVGKAAILERMKKNVAEDEDGATERFEILDVFAAGNYATEVGKYIRTAKDGTEKTGKYVSIFEKRDGKYICIRDIYNDDAKYEDNDDDGDEMGEADDADVEEGS
jgi:ketosteroid isomerase-like protein